jgi:hypothetical protein
VRVWDSDGVVADEKDVNSVGVVACDACALVEDVAAMVEHNRRLPVGLKLKAQSMVVSDPTEAFTWEYLGFAVDYESCGCFLFGNMESNAIGPCIEDAMVQDYAFRIHG